MSKKKGGQSKRRRIRRVLKNSDEITKLGKRAMRVGYGSGAGKDLIKRFKEDCDG